LKRREAETGQEGQNGKEKEGRKEQEERIVTVCMCERGSEKDKERQGERHDER